MKSGSTKNLTKDQITRFEAGMVTLSELANNIGVSKVTLHKHFKRKGVVYGSNIAPSNNETQHGNDSNQPITPPLQLYSIVEKAGNSLLGNWLKVLHISTQQLNSKQPPSPSTMRQIVANLSAAKEGLGIPPVYELITAQTQENIERPTELVIRRMTEDEEDNLRKSGNAEINSMNIE